MRAASSDPSVYDELQSVVADIASKDPTPGGGAVMAMGAAMAAALAAMAARLSPGCRIGDRPSTEVADELTRFSRAALMLADADVAAYQHYVDAIRTPREVVDRPLRISIAREDAANVPAAVCNVAAAIAVAAAEVGHSGNPRLRSDAQAAAWLASAAAQGATFFVAENTDVDNPRRLQARDDASRAQSAVAALEDTTINVGDRRK